MFLYMKLLRARRDVPPERVNTLFCVYRYVVMFKHFLILLNIFRYVMLCNFAD